MLHDELKVGLAEDKLMTVGSDLSFTRKLHNRLHPAYAGKPALCAVNLGVDFAPGVQRAARNAGKNARSEWSPLFSDTAS